MGSLGAWVVAVVEAPTEGGASRGVSLIVEGVRATSDVKEISVFICSGTETVYQFL